MESRQLLEHHEERQVDVLRVIGNKMNDFTVTKERVPEAVAGENAEPKDQEERRYQNGHGHDLANGTAFGNSGDKDSQERRPGEPPDHDRVGPRTKPGLIRKREGGEGDWKNV